MQKEHFMNLKSDSIYFGNQTDNLHSNGNYDTEKFLALQKKLNNQNQSEIKSLFFLKQTHSADVFVLENKNHRVTPLDLFNHEGDAIITREKNIGIGVVTADCLPLILYDSDNQAIGVIHAGWRGLSAKIITATILKMFDVFNTHSEKLKVYLGPSASACCYEVQNDFLSHFSANSELIEKRGEKLFFNARNAATFELRNNGVMQSNIDETNYCCTICTPGFCSVRKEKENAGRQPSVVFLR